MIKDIGFIPSIYYDSNKKHLFVKFDKDRNQSIRVEVKDPTKFKIKKYKKLFDSLTKSQKHCFIFLVCCIISKKTPIIQGPTDSGKSHKYIYKIIRSRNKSLSNEFKHRNVHINWTRNYKREF